MKTIRATIPPSVYSCLGDNEILPKKLELENSIMMFLADYSIL